MVHKSEPGDQIKFIIYQVAIPQFPERSESSKGETGRKRHKTNVLRKRDEVYNSKSQVQDELKAQKVIIKTINQIIAEY